MVTVVTWEGGCPLGAGTAGLSDGRAEGEAEAGAQDGGAAERAAAPGPGALVAGTLGAGAPGSFGLGPPGTTASVIATPAAASTPADTAAPDRKLISSMRA